ncbi:MAG: YggT family protein [Treponema sp.]|jgi:YggT family protein|nr:YggT family protein [Treponema sp.]
MRLIMKFLAALTGLYTFLIFVRVITSWFAGSRNGSFGSFGGYGRPLELLRRVTDPYLSWWSRFSFLRAGYLDLSPIAGMAFLSLLRNIFGVAAETGQIRLGIILFIALSSLWSALSFVIGFFIVVLVLRLIAFITNRNVYGGFWRVIDTISRPVLYRITRIFFRSRIINYLSGLIISILTLIFLFTAGGIAVRIVFPFLPRLPF